MAVAPETYAEMEYAAMKVVNMLTPQTKALREGAHSAGFSKCATANLPSIDNGVSQVRYSSLRVTLGVGLVLGKGVGLPIVGEHTSGWRGGRGNKVVERCHPPSECHLIWSTALVLTLFETW